GRVLHLAHVGVVAVLLARLAAVLDLHPPRPLGGTVHRDETPRSHGPDHVQPDGAPARIEHRAVLLPARKRMRRLDLLLSRDRVTVPRPGNLPPLRAALRARPVHGITPRHERAGIR